MKTLIFLLILSSPWTALLSEETDGENDGVHSHADPYSNVARVQNISRTHGLIENAVLSPVPEVSTSLLSTRALPAAVPIAFFVIGQMEYFSGKISKQKSHQQILNNLNEIKALALQTQQGVQELILAADFNDEQIQLADAHTTIVSQFNRMLELEFNNANNNQWKSWADDVKDGNSGTAYALGVINHQISTNNVIGKFKNRLVQKAGSLTRSVAGSMADFFKLQVIIEMVGFHTLDEANKLRACNQRDYQYKVMIQRLDSQIKEYKNVDNSLSAGTDALKPGVNSFGNKYFSMDDVRYAHLHPVEAQQGKIVTGVQLYKKGNRVAMRIKEGSVGEFGRIVPGSWKDASGWGSNYGSDYIKIYKGVDHYIDLHKVNVPIGKAIVGLSFYRKGNRLALKVKAASVNLLTGKVDSNAQWIQNNGFGNNYYDTESSGRKYVDTWNVETNPSGMLTAAGLYLKGNRMAIEVRDVFKPYAAGQSCNGYSNVKLIGNYGCCGGYLYLQSSQKCANEPTYKQCVP